MSTHPLPLEPMIEPSKISIWPLAPIWWIGIVLIIMILIFIVYYRRNRRSGKRHKPLTRKQMALKEIDQQPKPYSQAAEKWLQRINTVLKRVAVADYPQEPCHLLVGKAWLEFLNTKCPEAKIINHTILSEGLYKKDLFLDDKEIDALYQSVTYWINHHV